MAGAAVRCQRGRPERAGQGCAMLVAENVAGGVIALRAWSAIRSAKIRKRKPWPRGLCSASTLRNLFEYL